MTPGQADAGQRTGQSLPSVSRATAAGVAWLMLQSIVTRGTGFVSQLVLAWLLVPADFGLIGLANTVTYMVGILVNFGVDSVLLQRQRRMPSLNSTAVWFSLALGLLGMIVLLIAAPIAQYAYGVPGLGALMVPLALAVPLTSLAIVPGALLSSRLQFRFLAGYGAAELMFVQASTILLAWLGFGAFSFAIPMPVVAALHAAVFWYKAPVRVVRRKRFKQVRYLVAKGAAVFGTRIITELIGQGDYITLGFMASPAVVGVYYFAFRLAAQPVRMLAGSFSAAIFPALVKLGEDPPRQRNAAVNAALILSYVVMPVCFLQAALADPLIRMLFADKWVDAIPMVQVLSLGLSFDAVGWIAGSLLQARGEFRRSLLFSAVSMPVFFAFAAVGAWNGAGMGIAITVSLFYVAAPMIYSYRVFVGYGAGVRQVINVYLAPLAISIPTIGGSYLLSISYLAGQTPFIQLVVIGTAGSLAYVTALYVLDRAVFKDIAERLGLQRALSVVHRITRVTNREVPVNTQV